jgi:A/G-specific adenine glycosylase
VARHSFTHFDLELGLAIYAGESWGEITGDGEWWPVAAIEEAGLPTLFAKAARLARTPR